MSSEVIPSIQTQCGTVSIIGRPNVGKSTLLNHLVGYKISAIANKPQTTRTNIRGIVTELENESHPGYQIIFTDTPGIHLNSKNLLNRTLNSEAVAAVEDVDAIIFIVEALKWTDEDDFVISRLVHTTKPVLLLINKVDRIKEKERLFEFLQMVSKKRDFAELIPVSAAKGINTDILIESLLKVLPKSEFIYPEDYITDKSVRFICSELIREQLVLNLHEELPYTTAVEIERYEETDSLVTIEVVIWTDRKNQKGIIIGKKGETLKRIGQGARRSLEEFLMKKVMLKQWVKVEENWQNNPRHLNELGIISNREL
ncbi:GTPase Era [uncultured Cocleimonas sp.]|uniref:GTPase Era n=1 Tax=uncultured Cocleimonas sp. TaxID=1051587 RepID=UPI002605EBB2|nr:GTPase Era [uncultured Cocleimonas sp.]